jgi:orotate phosphoribosyltransferase
MNTEKDVVLNCLTPTERFIRYAINIGALEFVPEGRELKSGRISPYFFNSGLFKTGASIRELGKVYADEFLQHNVPRPEVVFGPAYKGIPLSVITAVALTEATGEDIGYAFNRKEEKTHGDGGTIVGSLLEGKNVLIVDDVMTTGTSSGEAVEIIRAKGGIPVACVIAFDRQERGKESSLSAVQEFQERYEIPVYAAATLSDLLGFSWKKPDIGNLGGIRDKIIAYRDHYGVQ